MILCKEMGTKWDREKCTYFGVVYSLEVFTFGGFTVLSHLINLQYILFLISRCIFIKIESYIVLSSNGVSQFSEIVTVQLTQLKFSFTLRNKSYCTI